MIIYTKGISLIKLFKPDIGMSASSYYSAAPLNPSRRTESEMAHKSPEGDAISHSTIILYVRALGWQTSAQLCLGILGVCCPTSQSVVSSNLLDTQEHLHSQHSRVSALWPSRVIIEASTRGQLSGCFAFRLQRHR
eukprot:Blabericola_migrator_1__7524@NODE_3844_length_1473_cov_5_096728_g2383_i0_p1_GENE_NODE_3844_length_1473_cov_5_096728_g2383_i0NODE_3844_length_1473_cov_5_096728_g2383_i0_p1_ORF_typecomplete_len136_score6_50Baculo_LEF10/PF07206_11/0_12_NODE_3844_length_1473_cov_5_096728_g2383_i0269676